MAMSYKARRRWAAVILLVGLPIYIVLALVLTTAVNNWIGRPHILFELGIYIGLGIVWVLPFKSIFMGVGQADPDAAQDDEGA